MSEAAPEVVFVDTRRGPARLSIHRAAGRSPGALAVLLHGAGTDTSAAPFPALAQQLVEWGVTAICFDQPYRVAGRRAPDPAHLLDAAFFDALPQIRATGPAGARLGLIGRSSGGRVACRCAREARAVAVACLGFPLQPPLGRSRPARPDRSAELKVAGVPVLVVQGERDPFGMPARIRGVRVRRVPGAAHVPTPAMARYAGRWLCSQLQAC